MCNFESDNVIIIIVMYVYVKYIHRENTTLVVFKVELDYWMETKSDFLSNLTRVCFKYQFVKNQSVYIYRNDTSCNVDCPRSISKCFNDSIRFLFISRYKL